MRAILLPIVMFHFLLSCKAPQQPTTEVKSLSPNSSFPSKVVMKLPTPQGVFIDHWTLESYTPGVATYQSIVNNDSLQFRCTVYLYVVALEGLKFGAEKRDCEQADLNYPGVFHPNPTKCDYTDGHLLDNGFEAKVWCNTTLNQTINVTAIYKADF